MIFGNILFMIGLIINICFIDIQYLEKDDVISYITKQHSLIVRKKSEQSKHYSLYKILVKDGLLEDANFMVDYALLVKENNRHKETKYYDFVVEKWTIDDMALMTSVRKLLSDVIYDSFYEKPPKIVIVDTNSIYIISTWGAVYRDDLYEIRKGILKKYNMNSL